MLPSCCHRHFSSSDLEYAIRKSNPHVSQNLYRNIPENEQPKAIKEVLIDLFFLIEKIEQYIEKKFFLMYRE